MRYFSSFFILNNIFLFISSQAFAIEDQKLYCTNLAKFTCAPGVNDDGTGATAKNNGNKALEFSLFYKSELLRRFNEILSNSKIPENNDFRTLSIHALGLTRGECLSAEPEKIKSCNAKISEGLMNLGSQDFPYDQNKIRSEAAREVRTWADGVGDLEETMFVRSHPIYEQILKQSTAVLTSKSPESGQTQDKIRNKIFPEIKKLLLKRISQLPLDDTNKKLIMSKVKAIPFIESPCMGDSPSKAMEKFTVNAFYEPASNSFHICGGLMELSSSDFDLAAIVAHEISHSIDPCSIQMRPEGMAFRYKEKTMEGMDKEYPIQGLIPCLRSEKSIRAENIAGRQYPQTQGNGPVKAPSSMPAYSSGNYNYFNGAENANSSMKEKIFNYCQRQFNIESKSMEGTDQITESIADWFASELVTEYIDQNYPKLNQEQWQNGLTNIFKALCSSTKSETNNLDVHPPLDKRLNAIFLANPKIRQKLDCTKIASPYVYCDAQNPDVLLQTYGRTSNQSTNPSINQPNNIMAPPPQHQ